MYETYPDDDEVGAFYAVALIAAVRPMNDDTYRLNMKAGAIGLDIFHRNPDHPGAAHYIIHAFDDPVHAPLALPAAERFAEIAEAVSHARHMPSHIFIQLGMWERVSRSNDSSYQAARDLWEPGDKVSDMTHATDWGQYGDLQREAWDDARARRDVMAEIVEMAADLEDYDREYPESMGDEMLAREILESERWEVLTLDDTTASSLALASGWSAIETGEIGAAKRARKYLKRMAAGAGSAKSRRGAEWRTKVARVQYQILAARLEAEAGRAAKARALLEEAIAGELELGPPVGTPPTIKPVREAYGEILLVLGRAGAAIAQFEESLLRTPNRRLSMRGLGNALNAVGREEEAREYLAGAAGAAEVALGR